MSPLIRFLVRFSVILIIVGSVFAVGLSFWLKENYQVPILMYHNVSAQMSGNALNNVSPKAFDAQMKFLKDNDYHVMSFADYIDGLRKGQTFARNSVIVQFDDGYEDNYSQAFPILKKYGFPATVYVVSDLIGTIGYLTWDQIREMDSHDFEIGAHTRRHVYLPEASLDIAKDEIVGSKKVIEEQLGHTIDHFCYPSGGFTDDVKGLVQQAGYQSAVTTNRGRRKNDLFEIRRIRSKDSDSDWVLRAKLSGYYNAFRKLKDGG